MRCTKGKLAAAVSLQAMGPRADVGHKGESGGGSEKSGGAADKVKASIGDEPFVTGTMRGRCSGRGAWRWPGDSCLWHDGKALCTK